jgi:hypothetical protein
MSGLLREIELTTLAVAPEEQVAVRLAGWGEHWIENWIPRFFEDDAARKIQKFYRKKGFRSLNRRIRSLVTERPPSLLQLVHRPPLLPFRGLVRTGEGEITDVYNFGRSTRHGIQQFSQYHRWNRLPERGLQRNAYLRPLRVPLHSPFLPELRDTGYHPSLQHGIDEAATILNRHPMVSTDLRRYDHFLLQFDDATMPAPQPPPHYQVFARTTRREGAVAFHASDSKDLLSYEKQQKRNDQLVRFLHKVKQQKADNPLRLVKTNDELSKVRGSLVQTGRDGGGGLLQTGGGGGGGGLERPQMSLVEVLRLLEETTDANIIDELIDYILHSF